MWALICSFLKRLLLLSSIDLGIGLYRAIERSKIASQLPNYVLNFIAMMCITPTCFILYLTFPVCQKISVIIL